MKDAHWTLAGFEGLIAVYALVYEGYVSWYKDEKHFRNSRFYLHGKYCLEQD
jgi:hypothetical protein